VRRACRAEDPAPLVGSAWPRPPRQHCVRPMPTAGTWLPRSTARRHACVALLLLLFQFVAAAVAVAGESDDVEYLPLQPPFEGVVGGSHVDADGDIYFSAWHPSGAARPYVAKLSRTLQVQWLHEVSLKTKAAPLGAPELVVSPGRRKYVMLAVGASAASGPAVPASLAVFALDDAAGVLPEPAVVVNLPRPIAAGTSPKCVSSNVDGESDVLYLAAIVGPPSSALAWMWKVRMTAGRTGRVEWEVQVSKGALRAKSLALAEDADGAAVLLAESGTYTGRDGREPVPVGDPVLLLSSVDPAGVATRSAYMRVNARDSFVSAVAVGGGGAIFLAEAPHMLHRLSLRRVEGRDSLTTVWSSSDVTDEIVDMDVQKDSYLFAAGLSRNLQVSESGGGVPVTVENAVVSVYDSSGGRKFRRVCTALPPGQTQTLTAVSITNASSGDAIVFGQRRLGDGSRREPTIVLAAFRPRSGREAILNETNGAGGAPSPNGTGTVVGDGFDRSTETSSNRGIAIGVGVAIVAVIVAVAVLAFTIAARQRRGRRAGQRQELEAATLQAQLDSAPKTAQNALA
jgi:hypothetical protein